MRATLPMFVLMLAVTTGLNGCAKSKTVDDMYAIPAMGTGHDNDAYYTAPIMYKGCAQIGDAPSCGGG